MRTGEPPDERFLSRVDVLVLIDDQVSKLVVDSCSDLGTA